MNRFSPQWAYKTSHPYAQYYKNNTYPGNSVMSTVNGMEAENIVDGMLLALAFGLALWLRYKHWLAPVLGGGAGFAIGTYLIPLLSRTTIQTEPPPAAGEALLFQQQDTQQQQSGQLDIQGMQQLAQKTQQTQQQAQQAQQTPQVQVPQQQATAQALFDSQGTTPSKPSIDMQQGVQQFGPLFSQEPIQAQTQQQQQLFQQQQQLFQQQQQAVQTTANPQKYAKLYRRMLENPTTFQMSQSETTFMQQMEQQHPNVVQSIIQQQQQAFQQPAKQQQQPAQPAQQAQVPSILPGLSQATQTLSDLIPAGLL
mgnify:CR=1 FL=1